jgi:hypothetical protein
MNHEKLAYYGISWGPAMGGLSDLLTLSHALLE